MFTAYMDAMRHYGDFDGRSSRSRFWYYQLVYLVTTSTLAFFMGMTDDNPIAIILFFLFALTHLIPTLSLSVRRLHDFNASGWFVLFSLIGGIVFVIIIGCIPSTPGPNRFGPGENESEILANTFS